MITAGVLTKYVREVASNGGVPHYTLNTDIDLSPADARAPGAVGAARRESLGAPPVLDNGVTLQTHCRCPRRT